MILKPKYLLQILFLMAASGAFAQDGLLPLSRFGIGELYPYAFINHQGMGDVSLAAADSNRFSMGNPASSARLGSYCFETGWNFRGYQQSNSASSYKNKEYNVTYFAYAIPLDTHSQWAFHMALLPVSRINFNTETHSDLPLKNTQYVNGNGGYTKFNIGTSKELLNHFIANEKLHHHFYMGVNAGYVFGHESIYHKYTFSDSLSPLDLNRKYTNYLGAISLDYGFIYKYDFTIRNSATSKTDKYELSLAGTMSSIYDVNSKKEYYAYTTDSIYDAASEKYSKYDDTLAYSYLTNSSNILPVKYGAGIRFKKNNNLSIGADINYTDWSKFSYFNHADVLKNSYSVSLGGEYTPVANNDYITDFGAYMKAVSYRGGVKYGITYYNINGAAANDMSLSLGMGFPIAVKDPLTGAYRRVSSIDFGIVAGNIGSISVNNFSQNYLRLSLGFHLYDIGWFYKRKID